MASVSIVLMLCSGFFVGVGLFPCLGWINWIALPLSALTGTSGVVGLFTDRDPETQRARGVLVHLVATVVGAFLVLVAAVRCSLGGGIF